MLRLLKTFLVLVCLQNLFVKQKFIQNLSEHRNNTGKFKRCIFLLLDGLRPDGYFSCNKEGNYHNNFDNQKYSFDFISMCDNPTLTAPRMYSMFTGAKSSFLDNLFGFYHKKRESDIFKELNVFYCGDETLKDLFGLQGETYNAYGNNFCIKKEYLSILNLIKAFKIKKEKTPELLIGHFSAVDALGHKKSSIQHKEIQNILKIYNLLLRVLTKNLDDDTFIVVTSDHGVRENGDHGNNSMEEITSFASFIFSKNKFNKIKNKKIKKEDKINEYYKLKKEYEIIGQNDIGNTIFSLLGCKYPKTTIGSIISWMVNRKDYLNLIINKVGMLKNRREMFKKLETKKFNNKNLLNFLENFDKQIDKFLIEPLNYLLIISCCLILLFISKESINFSLLFLFFMICHSVYSFIHEDILLSLFLSKNPFINLILLLVSGTPQHKDDRKLTLKIENSFFDIFLIFLINFIPENKNLKTMSLIKNNFNSFLRIFLIKKMDINLIVILIRMLLNLFNYDLPRESKIVYLIDSLDPMCFLYSFNKPIRCYFIYHLFNNKLLNQVIYYYFFIFLMGINWSINVNLNILYFFSDDFNFFTSFILVFFTYCYPRLKLQTDYNFEVMHFVINVLVSLVTYDQMVFLWFFGGRTLFQGIWCIFGILKSFFIK